MEIVIIKDEEGKEIKTLSATEVVELHKILSTHPELQKLTEPVTPDGIKSEHLLESAVSRQMVGIDEHSKYNDPYSNCATLVYGIACNHSFHNGNKRTALLSMIMHLYKNNFILMGNTKPNVIYDFITSIAANSLHTYKNRYSKYTGMHNAVYGQGKTVTLTPDLSISFISKWIRKNTQPRKEVDRPIKWSTLLKSLERFNISVEVDNVKNQIKLKRKVTKFFILKIVDTKRYNYYGEECAKHIVREIRKDFGLTTADGFDNSTFYTQEDFLDHEISTFKNVIYHLADN